LTAPIISTVALTYLLTCWKEEFNWLYIRCSVTASARNKMAIFDTNVVTDII